jgi:uncharacterized protein YaiL (DUF2058 family)
MMAPAVMAARRARVALAMESRRARQGQNKPASVVGQRPQAGPRVARASRAAQAAQRRRDGSGQGLCHPCAAEKEERIETERLKQEEARVRREAKAKLEELLKDKSLNAEAADIARHFPYGGKIKRIYVTAEQLTALNAGELGVVQLNGRYLLVTAEVLAQSEAVFAASVALKVDRTRRPRKIRTRIRSTRCRTTWSGNCTCCMMKTPGIARRFHYRARAALRRTDQRQAQREEAQQGADQGEAATGEEGRASSSIFHNWPAMSAPSTPPTPDENPYSRPWPWPLRRPGK